MFFCIISIFIALGIVGSYGYVLSLLGPSLLFLPAFSAILIIIFLLGIAQFIVGLWGAISCCQSCCGNDQPGQVSLPSQNFTTSILFLLRDSRAETTRERAKQSPAACNYTRQGSSHARHVSTPQAILACSSLSTSTQNVNSKRGHAAATFTY